MSSRPRAGAIADARAVAIPKYPMPSAKRGQQITSEATVAVVELENERPTPWIMRSARARESVGTKT